MSIFVLQLTDMINPEVVQYKAYLESTLQGEKCSVKVRPPLPTPHLRRTAKLALQAALPPLGTPLQPVEGEGEPVVVWKTIAAPEETRFLQDNLIPYDLERARSVVIVALRGEGLSIEPAGTISLIERVSA